MLSRIVLVLAAAAALAHGQESPSADAILAKAYSQAAATDRLVWVIFHASWCGWCKKLDGFIESAEAKPILEKYFVVARVDVQERQEKQNLNTPGGDELFQRLGGEGGLPFFAFLDAHGGTVVTSVPPGKDGKPGENIGYPGEPQEVDWFVVMLHKALPQMTAGESATLEHWLRHPPK
jgi:thioredoxin-related protein